MVPVVERSLSFDVGTFQHMAHIRDAATCSHEADLARAEAASTDEQHLTYVAKAAWWAAVADRCRATAKEDENVESDRR